MGGATQHGKTNRWRRSVVRPERIRRLGIGSVVFVICLVLVLTVLAYYYISGFTNSGYDDKGSFDSFSCFLLRLFLIFCLRNSDIVTTVLPLFTNDRRHPQQGRVEKEYSFNNVLDKIKKVIIPAYMREFMK